MSSPRWPQETKYILLWIFVSFLHLLTVFYSFDFCLWVLICFHREKGGKEHTVGLVERWGNLGGAAEGKEHNKNILYEKI